jgi:hypothetical protein
VLAAGFTPLVEHLADVLEPLVDRSKELGWHVMVAEVDPRAGTVSCDPSLGHDSWHRRPYVWGHQHTPDSGEAESARCEVYGSNQPCGQARPPRRVLSASEMRIDASTAVDDLVLYWPGDTMVVEYDSELVDRVRDTLGRWLAERTAEVTS